MGVFDTLSLLPPKIAVMNEKEQESGTGAEAVAGSHQLTFHGESGWQEALRVGGVVFAGFVVLGLGLGVLIASLGLPWWLAPLICLLVYAGSAEFILVGMLAAGAPLLSIATTTLLVNSRHLVYGLSFPLNRVQGRWAKLYNIYALSDEHFALNVGPQAQQLRSARITWIGFLLHVSWAAGSTLGAVIASSFLSDIHGVDFVMTALFIILALDAFRSDPDILTSLLAAVAAILAMLLAPQAMLTLALLIYLGLLIVRHFVGKSRGASRA